jgi:hypothetical protein
MGVDSRLGLKDTIPFGKHKGKTVEAVYTQNAGYLMWLRDAKAEPSTNPETGLKSPPNREFFDIEVLRLLNMTISADKGKYGKHAVWPEVDIEKETQPDDTPFDPPLKEADLYNQWGAF